MGPSDGEQDLTAGIPLGDYTALSGVNLGPEWKTKDTWIPIADLGRD